MAKEMLISTMADQECRIAIVDDGRLEELYVERASSASHVGNIYKGRITNVEPAIQAAFVDFGLRKNGFLHISDVHPKYFPGSGKEASEVVGRKFSHRDRPPIQQCLRRGQEVIVQMTKEGIGTKGPTMTTYLSIPGRLLVMMPGMSRLGVSRKVEDEDARQKAKQILNELKAPQDMGFIVRTAGINRGKRELSRDLNYLLRLWKTVSKAIKKSSSPAEIYRESDLVTRTIRDVYNSDIHRVVCDSPEVARKAKEILSVVVPRTKHTVELYTGREGLFHDYGLEAELERVYCRRVELPSGGSLVFDQTEALVAIDVNSGRFRQHADAETTAMKLNIEATREIARQLRLRDLGGVIVIDFVDMRQDKNRRAVERALRDAIKADRAKTKILRISALGLVEMTRQRIGPSLKSSIYRTCTECDGMGLIKSEESQSLLIMRSLRRACQGESVAQIEVKVTPSVAHHLANRQRRLIADMEARSGKRILIRADDDLRGEEMEITATNARGSAVAWEQDPSGGKRAAKLETVSVDDLPADVGKPEAAEALGEAPATKPEETGEAPKAAAASSAEEAAPKKSRRRGRRGGRKHKRSNAAGQGDGQSDQQQTDASRKQPQSEEAKKEPSKEQAAERTPAGEESQKEKGSKRPRRRGSRRRKKTESAEGPSAKSEGGDAKSQDAEPKQPDGERAADASSAKSGDQSEPREDPKPAAQSDDQAQAKPKRRRRSRRKKPAQEEQPSPSSTAS